MNADELLLHYGRVVDAPDAVTRLRRFILELAVRGKLLPQFAGDEQSVDLWAVASDGPRVDNLLPRGWLGARVGQLLDFKYGKGLASGERSDSGPTPVFGSNGVVGFTTAPLTETPSIIVGRKGSAGALNVCDGPSWTTDVAYYIEPPPFFQLRSLYLALLALRLDTLGKGVKPGLSRSDAYELELWVPPIAEQHRIVAKVDELMALCDRLEAARAEREAARDRLAAASLARLNAPDPETFAEDARFALDALPALTTRRDQIKQLRQTVLNLAVRGKLTAQDSKDEAIKPALEAAMARRASLVRAKSVRTKKLDALAELTASGDLPPGWSIARLGNLVDPENTISYGVLVPGTDVPEGVPFVRAQDLTLKAHPERPNKTIAPEVEAPYARTRLRGGEILVCVVGSIGKLGTVPDSWAGANIARAVARIVPIPEISRDYLLVVLQGQPVQDFFSETTRTLAQPTLNVGLIEQTPIPLPPIAEQHRIVASVGALMALCDGLESSLLEVDARRSRLLEALLQDALESSIHANAPARADEAAAA